MKSPIISFIFLIFTTGYCYSEEMLISETEPVANKVYFKTAPIFFDKNSNNLPHNLITYAEYAPAERSSNDKMKFSIFFINNGKDMIEVNAIDEYCGIKVINNSNDLLIDTFRDLGARIHTATQRDIKHMLPGTGMFLSSNIKTFAFHLITEKNIPDGEYKVALGCSYLRYAENEVSYYFSGSTGWFNVKHQNK
jgi:hypothetical protein